MNYKQILYVAAALAMTACGNDELPGGSDNNERVALQVSAGIGQTTTRISIDGSAAAFTTGDKINVVANETETHVYVLQADGTWQAEDEPYYLQGRNNVVSFRAWYADPSVKEEDNKVSIDTHTQTYSESGWNYHDILVTPEVETTALNPSVSFTGDKSFRHIMSQLVFTFKAGDGIPDLSELSGYTLDNIIVGATFDTQGLELTAEKSGKEGFIDITGIDDASGEEYTASPLILVPQTITSGKINLLVTYNEQTYKAELNVPEGDKLQPGYSYAYTVTISNTELEVGDAAIAGWVIADSNISFDGTGNATLK